MRPRPPVDRETKNPDESLGNGVSESVMETLFFDRRTLHSTLGYKVERDGPRHEVYVMSRNSAPKDQ